MLFSGPTKRYLDKLNEMIRVLDCECEEGAEDSYEKIMAEGMNLIMIGIERICLALYLCLGILIALAIK